MTNRVMNFTDGRLAVPVRLTTRIKSIQRQLLEKVMERLPPHTESYRNEINVYTI